MDIFPISPLTHFILNALFCHICWKSPFSIQEVLGYVNSDIFVGKWLKNLQNSGHPDQMPHYVASALDLHFWQTHPNFNGLNTSGTMKRCLRQG